MTRRNFDQIGWSSDPAIRALQDSYTSEALDLADMEADGTRAEAIEAGRRAAEQLAQLAARVDRLAAAIDTLEQQQAALTEGDRS